MSSDGALSKRELELKEARSWATVSTVLASIVLILIIASGAWPAVLLQLGSVVGSALFLCGGGKFDQVAVIILTVVAYFELIGGGVTLAVVLYLLAVPGSFAGFGLLLAIYGLIISIPIIAIGYVDLKTANLVRNKVYNKVEPTNTPSESGAGAEGKELPSLAAMSA
tara:strand:- start:82 stop:582 length:501 start_codon:yes stop_codon:yes gene_type:complete